MPLEKSLPYITLLAPHASDIFNYCFFLKTNIYFLSAFERLLQNLPDLTLDTPDASVVLGNFIARAVADDCLPPKFVMSHKENPPNDQAR